MITFPNTQYKKFNHANASLRWGQAFYNFMKLHKVTNPQDKEFCDRIYNEADDNRARMMVISRLDLQN